MQRIRTIKPDAFHHDILYDLERQTKLPIRWAFAGLWTVADRRGRFEWRPRILKAQILPHDNLDFSRVLHALTTRGFLVRYACQGREYGWIPGFARHQVVNNRESESSLPPCPEDPNQTTTWTRDPRVPDACITPLVQDQGEGKGREGKGSVQSEPRDEALQTEPDISTEAKATENGRLLHDAIGVWCRLYATHHHGAKYRIIKARHVPLLKSLLAAYDLPTLAKLCVILHTTDDPWVQNTDRGLEVLSAKANWLMDRLAAYEAKHGAVDATELLQ